jgi:hypothetical protein
MGNGGVSRRGRAMGGGFIRGLGVGKLLLYIIILYYIHTQVFLA